MAQFPVLKTGAAAQYPVKTTYSYGASVVSFLDGSEQRLRNAPSILHVWELALAQLDEVEMAAIQQFFLSNQGASDTFAFTDPWSGIVYPNCSISGDQLAMLYRAPLSSETKLVIRENRV